VVFGQRGGVLHVAWLDGTPAEPQPVEFDPGWWESVERLRDEFLLEAPVPDSGEAARQVDPLTLAYHLTSALLPRAFGTRLVDLLAGLDPGDHLQLTLEVDAGVADDVARRLWSLPWELLHPGSGYLLEDPRVAFTRVLAEATDDQGGGGPDGGGPLASGPLRVLVVEGPRKVAGAATLPPSTAHASLVELVSSSGDLVEVVEPLIDPDLESIAECLANQAETGEPVDVVVFEGHGHPDGLFLRPVGSPLGSVGELSRGSAIAAVLAGRTKVAVLASCWGGSSVRWEGVAEALGRSGTATVACQTRMELRPVARLAATVVRELAIGRTVGEAAAAGREELGTGHQLAWRSRLALWQPGAGPLRLRPPIAAARAGPLPGVRDARFGGLDWFVPRPGLVAELREAMDDERVRLVELEGPTGSGKSSVLRWWWESGGGPSLPAPAVAVLRDPLLRNIQAHSGRELSTRVASALAARTNRTHQLAERLECVTRLADADVWETLVVPEVEAASAAGLASRLTVLVDELDQASQEFMGILATAIDTSPSWMTWVCTSRPDMPGLSHLGTLDRRRVHLTDHIDENAVTELALRLLSRSATFTEEVLNRTAAEIGRRAAGVFLWARVICDLLLDADSQTLTSSDPIDSLRLPAAGANNDLHAIYEHALVTGPRANWSKVVDVVGIITACRDPQGFSTAELAALSGQSSIVVLGEQLRSAPLRHFLERHDDRCTPFHQDFTDWARTRSKNPAVTVGQTEATIGLSLDRLRLGGRLGDLAGYAQRHLVGHLVAALERLEPHHPHHPALTDALTGIIQDDQWLLDSALAHGPGAVAADLAKVRRWAHADVLGERHEVFVQTVKLTRRGDGSTTSLLTSLNNKATEWDEPSLARTAADHLTATGHPWWRVSFRTGPRHRAGDVIFTGHDADVTDVAWHPTQPLVATSDTSGNVYVWNPADPNVDPIPLPHDDRVNAVAWNHDGTRLATASWDGGYIWDPRNPKEKPIPLPHGSGVRAVAWNHDSTRLATVNRSCVAHIWNSDDLNAEPTTLPRMVEAVAWNHDSTLLATASLDRTAHIWNPDDPDHPTTTLPHDRPVHAVAWNHKDTRLATASSDGAYIWDPRNPKKKPIPLPHDSGVRAVAWNHDGTRLATASWDGGYIWDPRNPKKKPIPLPHDSPVRAVAWNHDGTLLATASLDGAQTWNPDTPAHPPPPLPRDGAVRAVAWSHDDTRLATASDGVHIWDPAQPTADPIPLPHGSGVSAVAWNHKDTRLATASIDGVHIWDPAQPTADPITLPHGDWVVAVAWSHDDTRLATASWEPAPRGKGTARIWNLDDPHTDPIPLPHDSGVSAVAWNHDGTRLATASWDGGYIWDPRNPKEKPIPLPHDSGVRAVAWNHKDTRLATASSDGAYIWDPRNPKKKPIPLPHDSEVSAVAWNRKSTRLATVSGYSALIWNPGAPDHPTTTLPHGSPVRAVAWSHDDTRLTTASSDGSVRIWELVTPAS